MLMQSFNIIPYRELVQLQQAEDQLKRAIGGSNEAILAQNEALKQLHDSSRMSQAEGIEFFATIREGVSSVTMTTEQIAKLGRQLDSALPGQAAAAGRSLQQLWDRFPEHQMAMQRGVVSLTALAEAYRTSGQAGFDAASSIVGYSSSLSTLQQKLRGITNAGIDASAALSKDMGVERWVGGAERVLRSFSGVTAEIKTSLSMAKDLGLALASFSVAKHLYQGQVMGGHSTGVAGASVFTRGQTPMSPLFVSVVGGGVGIGGGGYAAGGPLIPNPTRSPSGMILPPGQTPASAGWLKTQWGNPIIQAVAATIIIEGATILGSKVDEWFTHKRADKTPQENLQESIRQALESQRSRGGGSTGYLTAGSGMGVSREAFYAMGHSDTMDSLNRQLSETTKSLQEKSTASDQAQPILNAEFSARRAAVDNIEERIRRGESTASIEGEYASALAQLNEVFNKQKTSSLELIKREQENLSIYDRRIALLKTNTGMANVQRDILQQLMPGNFGMNMQATMAVANAKMAEAEEARRKADSVKTSDPLHKTLMLEAAQAASDALKEVTYFRRSIIEQMGSQAMNLTSGTYTQTGAPLGGLKPGDSIRGMPSIASWAGSGYSDFAPLAKGKDGKFVGRQDHGTFESEFGGRFGAMAGMAQGYLPVLADMAMKGETSNIHLASIDGNIQKLVGAPSTPNQPRAQTQPSGGSANSIGAPPLPHTVDYKNTGSVAGGASKGALIGASTGAFVGGLPTFGIGALPGAAIGAIGGAIINGTARAIIGDGLDLGDSAVRSNYQEWLLWQSGGDAEKRARVEKWISEQFKTTDPLILGSIVTKKEGGFKTFKEVSTSQSPERPSFAGGGDFYTNGPMTMTVGDNPGGVERVSVTPVSGRGVTRGIPGGMAFGGGTPDRTLQNMQDMTPDEAASVQRMWSLFKEKYPDVAAHIDTISAAGKHATPGSSINSDYSFLPGKNGGIPLAASDSLGMLANGHGSIYLNALAKDLSPSELGVGTGFHPHSGDSDPWGSAFIHETGHMLEKYYASQGKNARDILGMPKVDPSKVSEYAGYSEGELFAEQFQDFFFKQMGLVGPQGGAGGVAQNAPPGLRQMPITPATSSHGEVLMPSVGNLGNGYQYPNQDTLNLARHNAINKAGDAAYQARINAARDRFDRLPGAPDASQAPDPGAPASPFKPGQVHISDARYGFVEMSPKDRLKFDPYKAGASERSRRNRDRLRSLQSGVTAPNDDGKLTWLESSILHPGAVDSSISGHDWHKGTNRITGEDGGVGYQGPGGFGSGGGGFHSTIKSLFNGNTAAQDLGAPAGRFSFNHPNQTVGSGSPRVMVGGAGQPGGGGDNSKGDKYLEQIVSYQRRMVSVLEQILGTSINIKW